MKKNGQENGFSAWCSFLVNYQSVKLCKNELCSYQVLVEVFAWYLFMSLVVEVSHSFSTLNIVKTKFNLTPPEFQQPKDRKFDLPLWRFEYPPYKRPKAIPNNVQDIIVSKKEFTKFLCTLHNDKVYDNIRSGAKKIHT